MKKALELMAAPPIFDIEATPSQFNVETGAMENELGKKYFGDRSNSTETVGQTFDREAGRGTNSAWTARARGGVAGIFYRGSRTSFLGNANFLFHEIVHFLQPITGSNTAFDDDLVETLAITVDKGMTSSKAVSRYFNSGCDPKYGGVVIQ